MQNKLFGVDHFSENGCVIDNIYENYDSESCYTCIHCTEKKYCGKTGLPIPMQGKTMWKNCSEYECMFVDQRKSETEKQNNKNNEKKQSTKKQKRKKQNQSNKLDNKKNKKKKKKQNNKINQKNNCSNHLCKIDSEHVQEIKNLFNSFEKNGINTVLLRQCAMLYEILDEEEKYLLNEKLKKESNYSFIEWVKQFQMKEVENKVLSVNEKTIEIVSNETNRIYGNIFFLCLKNKKSFKNIIYQASSELFQFQTDILVGHFANEDEINQFSPITYFVMYLSRIADLIGCELLDIFKNYGSEKEKILLDLVKDETKLFNYPIFVCRDVKGDREYIVFELKFKEVEFNFSVKKILRYKKIELLRVNYKTLSKLYKNKLEDLIELQNDKELIAEKIRVKKYDAKNHHVLNKINVLSGKNYLFSPLSTKNLNDGIHFYINAACIAIKRGKNFPEIIDKESKSIGRLSKILKVDLDNKKNIDVHSYFQNDFVLTYMKNIAKDLYCEIEDIFKMDEYQIKNIVYNYLKNNCNFDEKCKSTILELDQYGNLVLKRNFNKRKVKIAISTSFFEYYFSYDVYHSHKGRQRDFDIYNEINN